MEKPRNRQKIVLSAGMILAFLISAVPLAPLADDSLFPITIDRDVPVEMRDGIILKADIYRPLAPGKYPVLLMRTCYGKSDGVTRGIKFAQRGYVVVSQDVRGRFGSGGDWYPFKYESQDGYDTIEWAAALPYADGQVGMFGGSYLGATQYLAAIASPPHLCGLCPTVTPSNYHDGWVYHGGVFEQWFNESWTSFVSENAVAKRFDAQRDALAWKDTLPLADYPVIRADDQNVAPHYSDWLAHPDYDDYWKAWSIEENYDRIEVPVLAVGGWYDIFLGGTLRNFLGLKARAGSETARRNQRLVIMAGGHAGWFDERRIGALDFGPDAVRYDGDEITLRWYDWLLKGKANGMEREKPVKIFVMGKNAWRDEEEWPLARARSTRYYLHAKAPANGPAGRGTLDTRAPSSEKPDRYTYDPADPVPTIGGQICCEFLPPGAGPFDQRPVEARTDVLVYTTPAFARTVEVTGPVRLELFVSSSALDTDFIARLIDVWPDGFAQNLTDGILRLRYRNSPAKAEAAKPGEIYPLHIDMGATSNVFLPGHRLRLEITSSNYPRFARNLNTGEPEARATRMIKAENTIYHDRRHPSVLVLPIVPGE